MKRFVQSPADIWSPQCQELLTLPVFIAGGMARWLVLAPDCPEPEDIDVFLYDEKALRPVSIELTRLGYTKLGETERSIGFEHEEHGVAVQLIKPIKDDWTLTYGTAREVLSRFSFTTEMFAACQQDGKCWSIVGEQAIEDTRNQELVINQITDPLAVGLRIVKYAQKGYNLPAAEMLRLLDDWASRSPEYRRQVHKEMRAA